MDRVERQLRGLSTHDTRQTTNEPEEAASPDLRPDRPFEETSHVTRLEERTHDTRHATQDEEQEEQEESVPESESVADDLDFADFERAWPAIVAQIRQDVGPRRHALLKEASPAGIEDGIVVFEVASHMHFHLEQLKADEGIAEAISVAGNDQLGQPISVSFRSADAPPKPETVEVEVVPDKDDLVESQSDGDSDVIDNVLGVLGGEIVGD